MVRVVFDDVAATEAMSYVKLPLGAHEVTITECEDAISSNGNDGLKMTFADAEGRTVKDAVWVTPKSMANVLRFARAIGCEPESGVALMLTPEAVMGRRLLLRVVDEERDGKVWRKTDYMGWEPPAIPNGPWSAAAPTQAPAERVAEQEIPF